MPKRKAPAVPVSKRAAIARINRKLRKDDGQMLKATRGERGRGDLGDFYLLDVNRNVVRRSHVDVEDFARELDVLAPWEGVVDDEEAENGERDPRERLRRSLGGGGVL